MELDLWGLYCMDTGTSLWAVNEGKMDIDENIQWEIPKRKEA